MDNFKILVVDDEIQYQEVINMILQSEGYKTKVASSGEEALEILKKEEFHLVLTDLKMNGMDGIHLLEEIKNNYINTYVMLITGFGTIKNAVEAMKKGAFGYFIKGNNPGELIREIEKVKKECESTEKVEKINNKFLLDTKNYNFRKILEIAKKAASADVNVLITGESGTGKEVMARFIYENSERKNEKFVPVNCQAFSSGLLESELFGHEKGSFTGAVNKRIGRFEEAHGGTLFLDEVGEIDLNTQVKLLRVLENRTIEKIGSNKPIDVDFRLICATNKDFYEAIENKEFREDLFYRINTISIHLPSLKERKEDLPMLIDFFLKKSSAKYNKKIVKVEDDVMNHLLNYEYKGNIRELKNILDRLVVLSENGIIGKEFVSANVQPSIEPDCGSFIKLEDIKPLKEIKQEAEANYIKKVLGRFNGNITKSAEYLEISRRQLFNKIVEYNVKEDL
ncbi:sigma-54-dependent transcriptional regulator [Terrisporobacter mayombei]|uniref:Stage 0 sporulation protein A homolog n=1 Tax=Terrisporobacter mayombei TaxID=1541 RepID=A0ABY9Q769_9FIRM|nr:sigma-54 dependent transcriptional regulator [Terrisporobacter mayombei]MCC3869632.1 sigma-54 dependent transcriptional regulator [Terrisporobacter mayombei]WMT83429.1 Transcriptional regulatory protein ZraR [Terrisporobacter mayombei]